jgi:hypothetical protein
MDKDVKDILDWFQDKEGDGSNLWEMSSFFEGLNEKYNADDKTAMLKVFNEEQLAVVTQILKNVVHALEFHGTEDDGTHPDLREQIKKVDAKLRNHRHELNKNFSAKAEF